MEKCDIDTTDTDTITLYGCMCVYIQKHVKESFILSL